MGNRFLLYGANGFVGRVIARMAKDQGLQPVVAGRSAAAIQALGEELGVESRVFDLQDPAEVDRGLAGMPVVLHCAGPFIYTYQAIAEGCLRSGAHYLDLTGEIPVYSALAERDAEAQSRGVMLLPGAGFDVVPSDCLAVYLKERLPSATYLALAFHSRGPGGIPPGTARTSVENLQHPTRLRRGGQLVAAPDPGKTRLIDFGNGQRRAGLISWGDIFMAYHSTGIPNIENYIVLPQQMVRMLALLSRVRPIFKSRRVRQWITPLVPSGSTPEQRAQTTTHVWGEVIDNQGNRAAARLHGPEAGVDWTALAALAVVKRVLAGDFKPGFQTPGRVYGADFALEAMGVTREDCNG
jgi:short subunit dehydrogenase-like uncharacterized protein